MLQEASPVSKPFSSDLEELFDRPCWYHGTEQHFISWIFPPPIKPGEDLAVPHTAVFFTSNFDFAKGAGSKVAVVSLKSKSNVLDATSNYSASEKLRTAVAKNQIAARTLNVTHDYWHDGWKSGAVLRVAHTDSALDAHFNKMAIDLSKKLRIEHEQASSVVHHNITRGLIELICSEAKRLGFDALYGHEIDKHSEKGKILSQPWLAVFVKDVITEPEWL